MNNPQLRARYLDSDNDKNAPGPGHVGVRSAAVALAVVILVVAASPAVAQEGRTYAVTFLNTADDLTDEGCMTFSTVAPGKLTFEDEEEELTLGWGHTKLNTSKKFFIAFFSGGAIAGKVKGGGRRIVGDGIEGKELLSFKGKEDPDCVSKLRLRRRRR